AAAWNLWSSEHAAEIRDGSFIPLIQGGLKRHPDLPGIPLMQELVERPDLARVMEFVSSGAAIGRALIAPPKLPPARLAALRAAFDRMAADPDLIRDAKARHAELAPTPGAKVQE